MASVGDVVYLACQTDQGAAVELCGWVVEIKGADVIVAVRPKSARNVAALVKGRASDTDVGFLRVAESCVSLDAPSGWLGPRPWGGLPPLRSRKVQAASSSRGLQAHLEGLAHLFGEDGSEAAEVQRKPKSSAAGGHLAAGDRASGKSRSSRDGPSWPELARPAEDADDGVGSGHQRFGA